MLHLNEEGVEVLKLRYENNYRELYWDNYDVVLWNKNPNGFNSIKGLFRKDSWGLAQKISINNNGMWEFPRSYVKHFR